MLVDTHTHLYLPEFDDPDAAVRSALDAGVGHMVFPNVDLTTVEPMLALHRRFPDVTSVALGLHPTEVGPDFKNSLVAMRRFVDSNPDIVAIGEIGMDLYWDTAYRKEQREALAIQFEWANELGLPVIIHSREGLDDILDVARGMTVVPHGVMHSFAGSAADIKRILDTGDFYFGINGIATFKNSKLREVLPMVPRDRLLMETDSPYLAPVPKRGRRNESAYMVHTAAFVAGELGLTVDELAEITTDNACRLFGLKM